MKPIKNSLLTILSFYILFFQQTYAGGFSISKIEYLALKSQTVALGTHDGQLIPIQKIKERKLDEINKKLLEKKDLELKDGQIIYPSDLDFALIKNGGKSSREPHNPN